MRRLGKGGHLGRYAARPEVRDELLRGHEAAGPRLSEGLRQLEIRGVREAVGRADLVRHVHADPLRRPFGDELLHVDVATHDVVGAAGFEHVAVHAERGALDAGVVLSGALPPVPRSVKM